MTLTVCDAGNIDTGVELSDRYFCKATTQMSGQGSDSLTGEVGNADMQIVIYCTADCQTACGVVDAEALSGIRHNVVDACVVLG